MKSHRGLRRRLFATNPQPLPKKMTDGGEDFRPPWVYVCSRLIIYGIIPGISFLSYMELTNFKSYLSPAVGFHSIFFYDFGDREHVFQPVSCSSRLLSCLRYSLFLFKFRRWGANLMNKLFTLSTSEERLLRDSQASMDTNLTKDWGLAEVLYGKKSFTKREAIREQNLRGHQKGRGKLEQNRQNLAWKSGWTNISPSKGMEVDGTRKGG